MTPGATPVPPPMKWAQRNDFIYLTVNIESNDAEYKFTEDTMTFKGTGLPENKPYEITFNFLNKISSEKVRTKTPTRCIEFYIPKAESGPYWPSLTNDKKKPHWLKIDFNKWEDENSDDEEESGNMDLNGDMFKTFENVGASKPSFADLGDEEEDSDDDLSDLVGVY